MARKRGFKFLGVLDRSDLLAYLEGTADSYSCANIVQDVLEGRKRPRDEGPEPPRSKRARVDAQTGPNGHPDPNEVVSYGEFMQRVRQLQAVEFIGRKPNTPLSDIMPLLKIAEHELARWHDIPRPTPKTLSSRRPFIQELEDNLRQNPKDRPIILVPMNKNAPVNMLNVYQLLQEGKYVKPDKTGNGAFGGFEALRKEVVEVVRTVNGKRWTFEVRDSTKGFTKGQWKRVVAVITDGADWQFKGWPFETLVDLFCTVKGIYFRERSKYVELPEHVTKWRVNILDLASTHLQHRFQALRDAFWNEVEDFMRSERVAAFSNVATLDGRRTASDAKLRAPIL